MSRLRIEFEVAQAPALVWRALTEAKPLNRWFQPVAGWPESSAGPGAQGRVYPTDDLPGFGEFDIDLIESEPFSRLVFRWRGDDFTSEVTFLVRAVRGGGSAVTMHQTGLLGSEAAQRWEALARAHDTMIERMRTALDRLALGVGESDFLVAEAPAPTIIKAGRRARLLGLAGATVAIVLCGTAAAVWLNEDGQDRRPPPRSARGGQDGQDGQTGMATAAAPQPSIGASPSKKPAPVGTPEGAQANAPSSPAAVPSPASLSASYRTVTLLGLGGFDTEVTVKNPGSAPRDGWTVVLTMPDASAVENRSTDTVKLTQEGQKVTLTPVKPVAGNATVSFVVRFPALLALGKSVTACTIDGQACAPG